MKCVAALPIKFQEILGIAPETQKARNNVPGECSFTVPEKNHISVSKRTNTFV